MEDSWVTLNFKSFIDFFLLKACADKLLADIWLICCNDPDVSKLGKYYDKEFADIPQMNFPGQELNKSTLREAN